MRRTGTTAARAAASLAAVFLPGAAAPVPPAPQPRPSVVLITLDTTRADHLGCYGDAAASTPRIDALARAGVRFAAAVSPVPLTLPAHASIMSGRVPRRHGVRDNAGFRLEGGVPLLAERLRAAGYATAAFVSAAVLDRDGGLARGFDVYDDSVRIGDRRAFDYQERAASQTVDAALARLPSLARPFFVWLHLYDPHAPYVPPAPFSARFQGRPYDGEIAFADAQAGRLLDAVRASGARPIVIVAGDHGEGLGDHGEATHGVFLYQATQHVPLVLEGPGIPAGKTVAASVGLIDIAPSVLDLLGLPPIDGADGRSLVPLLRGRSAPAPDYELETLYPSLAYGWAPLRGLVSGRYKLVEAPRPELYDLATDPAERNDLREREPGRADDFAKALAALTAGDAVAPPAEDAATAERREKLASLGYVGGSTLPAGGAIDPKDGVRLLPDLDAARRDVQLGDPKDAIPKLERLLAKNPENIPARLELGQAQLASGRIDDAIATYRGVTGLAGGNALAWFDYGNALARKAATDDAAVESASKAYERALALSPRHADTYLNYAALLASRKRPEEARKLFLRARGAGVEDPTLETELGALELGRHDDGAAREAFARAVALDPREPVALEGLGKLAYAAGEFAGAAAYYERALAARPAAALAKTLGAIRLYHLDDRAGALAAFRRALALLPPGSPDAGDLEQMIADLSR